MYLVLFLLLIIMLTIILIFSGKCEAFDDYVNHETQERAGPMDETDKHFKQVIDERYPKMSTYFVPFRRFYVELFEEDGFKHPITTLRDSTEQFISVRTHKPIRSIRIRSVPNHHWRFLQFFTVGIYLEEDRSKGVLLHVPQGAQSIDYQITDTRLKGENLEWLNSNDSKIIYYTTNYYDPMLDLTI